MSRGLGKTERKIIDYLKDHKKCKEFEEIEIKHIHGFLVRREKSITVIPIEKIKPILLLTPTQFLILPKYNRYWKNTCISNISTPVLLVN